MVTATKARKGIYGIETEAFGADPSQIDRVYQFRYKVVALDDVTPSHNDNLTPNADYPAELQPRLRDRAAIVGIDTPRRLKSPKPKSKAPTTGLKSFKRGKIYHTPTRGGTLLSRRPLGRRR